MKEEDLKKMEFNKELNLSNEVLDLSELENVEGGAQTDVIVVGCAGKGGGCSVTKDQLQQLGNPEVN